MLVQILYIMNVGAKAQSESAMADDSDFAFNLQMEEALTASLLDGAVSSPKTDGLPYDAVFGPALSAALQDDGLYKYECELLDQYETQAAAKRLSLDLHRQVHDRALACEISNLPEEEWIKIGDDLQRPYGEGSSSSSNERDSGFRVFIKGLVGGRSSAIAVAILDGKDGLVFELSKSFGGKDQNPNVNVDVDVVEFKALIEGLDAAVMLGLKRPTIVTDNWLLYLHVTGINPPVQQHLSSQIGLRLWKLGHISASFVEHHEIEFVVELARKAIALEVNRSAGSSNTNNLTKTCSICLEDTHEDQMFLIAGCLHSYCLSCMSKHVHFQLLNGILPKCPAEYCQSPLEVDSCTKFLAPDLLEIMCQRVKEASIPPEERIYCPYSRCSALLSKTELQGSKGDTDGIEVLLGGRKCPSCGNLFCINCKLPWHSGMSCSDIGLNPELCRDEKKLKSLATENLWRHCEKCNHMVSLDKGCNQVKCRCGHQFCYRCGAEGQTCSCSPLDED